MNASTALWVGQVLLGINFATVGFARSVGFETTALRRGMGWMTAVGRGRMRIIGGKAATQASPAASLASS
jgi:hypothetical protein